MYNGTLFSHKKWNSAVDDNMDRSWGYYAKWNSHMEKDKYHVILSKSGIKKNQYEQNKTKTKLIDTEKN